MKTFVLGLVATGLVLAFGSTTTMGTDLAPVASNCTYEAAGTGDFLENTYPAPGSEPVTGDGSVAFAGCLWEYPDTSSPGFPGANFEGLGNPACKDIGAGIIPEGMACVEYGILVGGQYGLLQASIVDVVHGTDIAGFACSDNDNDYTCGDDAKGEIAKAFCSVSPLFDTANATGVVNDSDGNGHADWGHGVAIFVDGPLFQGFLQQTLPDEVGGEPVPFGTGGDCATTSNPTGGTRGTITINFSG